MIVFVVALAGVWYYLLKTGRYRAWAYSVYRDGRIWKRRSQIMYARSGIVGVDWKD